MCFGGSQKVTQTTKQELSPEQRRLLNTSMGLIEPVAGNLPTQPTVPGFNENQQAAQAGMLGASDDVLKRLADNNSSATNFLTSGAVMDPASNPALQGAIDASNNTLTRNFQNTVMPGVRGGAIQAGALGSSKARQAGDYAASSYMKEITDSTNTLLNNAYGQNLDAMLKGIALTPQSQSAALFPDIVKDTVGGQQRTLQMQQGQQQFDAEMFPFMMGLQLLGASAATPGGGTTGTVTGAQPQSSPLQQGLGGLASLLAFL